MYFIWCPESRLVTILYLFHDQGQEWVFLALVYLLKLWIRRIKETRPQETFIHPAPFVTKVAMVLERDRSHGKQEKVLYYEGLQLKYIYLSLSELALVRKPPDSLVCSPHTRVVCLS